MASDIALYDLCYFVLCYSRTRQPANFSCRETAWPFQTRLQAKDSQLKYPCLYMWQYPRSSFQTSLLLHTSVCWFVLYKLQAKFEDSESILITFWTTTTLNKSKVHSICHRKNMYSLKACISKDSLWTGSTIKACDNTNGNTGMCIQMMWLSFGTLTQAEWSQTENLSTRLRASKLPH